MMFVNQMAAPRPSRSVALIPWMPFMMSTISTTTPPMVPAVMIAISTIVDRRAARERRSIRPGSRMITTIEQHELQHGEQPPSRHAPAGRRADLEQDRDEDGERHRPARLGPRCDGDVGTDVAGLPFLTHGRGPLSRAGMLRR